MKRTLISLALAAVAPLGLAACANGYTGLDVGYGYAGGYGYPGYYPAFGYGWDPYDVWYDGFYGPYYNGYWGTDGFFWYQGGDHRWHRGDRDHFHHGGNWHNGGGSGQWQHYTGQPLPGWGTGPRGTHHTQSGLDRGQSQYPEGQHTQSPRRQGHSSNQPHGGGSPQGSHVPGWGTGPKDHR
jgi:hypothetical protein